MFLMNPFVEIWHVKNSVKPVEYEIFYQSREDHLQEVLCPSRKSFISKPRLTNQEQNVPHRWSDEYQIRNLKSIEIQQICSIQNNLKIKYTNYEVLIIVFLKIFR